MAEYKEESSFLSPNPFHPEDSKEVEDLPDSKSEYEEIEAITTQSAELQTFIFAFTSTHRHIRIVSEKDNTPLYYADFSLIKPGKPDVTLHSGRDDTGPVVGVTKLRPFQTGFKVGLGDPDVNGGNDVVWEDVKYEGTRFFPKDPQHGWTMSPTGSVRDWREFVWQREKYLNWKLVDDGEVKATFQSTRLKSWSQMGKLKVAGDLGTEWEKMALLVMLGIVEQARRRRA